MRIAELCGGRKIRNVQLDTPWIVPSFSSRGFPDLNDIYSFSKPYLGRVSLVSAYDLHHGHMPSDDIFSTDGVLVDSGGYEAKISYDPLEAYACLKQGKTWSLDNYINILNDVRGKRLSEVVIVSFDHEKHGPTEAQIQRAIDLSACFKEFPLIFLYKPESNARYFVSIADLRPHVHQLGFVSGIGITEKELGASFLDRCHAVLELRRMLLEATIDIPIHIFGCLDPVATITYFLCGADIFDGLSWLRYQYTNAGLMYKSSPANTHLWGVDDFSANELIAIKNLSFLSALNKQMHHFLRSHSLTEFEDSCNIELLRKVVRNFSLEEA